MYDPTIGRWLAEDPIGFDGGDTSMYRYVGNNPTNAMDPSGEYLISEKSEDAKNLAALLKKYKINDITVSEIQFSPKDDSLYYVDVPLTKGNITGLFAFARDHYKIKDLVGRRPKEVEAGSYTYNHFLDSVGLFGEKRFYQYEYSVVDGSKGFHVSGPSSISMARRKRIIEAVDKIRKKKIDWPTLQLDLGGEGRYVWENGAPVLNVNILATRTAGDRNKLIPHFVYGDAGKLPFRNETVSRIWIENLFIDETRTKESLRVLEPGGTITLYGPATEVPGYVAIYKKINPRLTEKKLGDYRSEKGTGYQLTKPK